MGLKFGAPGPIPEVVESKNGGGGEGATLCVQILFLVILPMWRTFRMARQAF